MTSLLSSLTLVIPTFERQQYALRNMRFWSGTEATVIVLDGSEQSIGADQLVNLAKNIQYCHRPVSPLNRLRMAVDLIQTEYTALLGDDEFFLKSGIEACIKELNENLDLVSCMGRCLAFSHVKNLITGWPDYTEMGDYAIQQEGPIERMVKHMNPYTCSAIYSVVKSEQWKKAMKIAVKHQFSVFAMGEYQYEMAVSFQGKSKVINTLLWLRNRENIPIRDEHDRTVFYRWWKDRSKNDERSKFVEILTEELSLTSKLTKESINNGVIKAADAFTEWCISNSRLTWFDRLLYFLSLRTPQIIKKSIKSVLNPIRRLKPRPEVNFPSTTLLQAAQELTKDGVKVDFIELNHIIKLLHHFHNIDANDK